VSQQRATPEEIAGRRANLSPGLVQFREGPEAAAIQTQVFEQLQESKRQTERIAASLEERASAESNANARNRLSQKALLAREMMGGGALHSTGKRVTVGEINQITDLMTTNKPIPKNLRDIVFISPTGAGADKSGAQQFKALEALHQLTTEQNNVAKAVKNKEIKSIDEARSQLGPKHEGMIDLSLVLFGSDTATARSFIESRMQFARDLVGFRSKVQFLTVNEMLKAGHTEDAAQAQAQINQLFQDRIAVSAGGGTVSVDDVVSRALGVAQGTQQVPAAEAAPEAQPAAPPSIVEQARTAEAERRAVEQRRKPTAGPTAGRRPALVPRQPTTR
jgi:hypothetical protein